MYTSITIHIWNIIPNKQACSCQWKERDKGTKGHQGMKMNVGRERHGQGMSHNVTTLIQHTVTAILIYLEKAVK